MIRILVVEDEQEKSRLIAEALLETDGITSDAIERAVDVADAIKRLRTARFDLLILDINVPLRLDSRIVVGGGLRILSAIRDNLHGVIAPDFIVGLTAYDDGFAKATDDFSNPLWKLVRFDYGSEAWRRQIKLAAKFLAGRNHPPFSADGSTYHTSVGIVVGLEDVELQSVLALSPDFISVHVPHDPIRYFKGSFSTSGKSIDVVVAAAPKMGMPVAAVVTTKLIATFRPRFLIMSGICAGVRGKVALGDVIVADPCWDWGSGKITVDLKGKEATLPAPYQWRLDTDLRNAIWELGKDGAFMASIYDGWAKKKPKRQPSLHIDALASGAAVLARKEAMSAIRKQHKNLIGVEMEIYAVLTAAEYASTPRPISIGIKSVCDFGDEKKNDYAHVYAAYVSANFAKEAALRFMVQ